MKTKNNNLLGISFMILSMFCLSVNDITYKYLSFHFPVWESVFFRALSGSIIALFLVTYFGFNKLKTQKPVGHLIRAFSASGCVVFYIYGINNLMLSENIAIAHSAPIIAAFLAVPILGEKIGILRSSAILIGFVGVLIIVKPGTDLFKLESLYPLISACFMASVYLSTRSVMSTDSSVAIIFYYSFALLVTSLIFFPKNFIMPSTGQIIIASSLGVMGSLGHLFMSQAAKYADVAVTSPFEYSSFIFVGLMGFLIFSEVPTYSIYIGGFIIIFSGIFIAYRERKNN
tara:strand:- start:330 stop:1190 length:861 start_codon:yes stop_codon:yes gene_type:complete